ncbi:hypothetical protein B484DRAFT_200551 [Ochromonadaceae sp. CCMP2298]|nr:hypothetical protein B484DRAFT_200551 [Ochromonadaceae sp. CCMP2298]
MQNMNPLYMTGDLRHSFVLRVTHNFRDSVIQKHFSRIFLLKISPLILSSLAMLFIFLEFSPLVVLPIVAGIEFVGDFLPDLVVSSVADWKELNPTSEFAEERLGLLFMLVLGEAVLGFSSINYDPSRTAQIYQTLTFSFFTIFTIGMQYFEPLQEYTKPMGQHPLSIKGLSPIYVWLIALTSFLMLVAANGMTELYYYVSNHEENNLADVTYQEEKVSTCLASVVVLMLVLKVLDKVYYREKLLPFGWLDSLYEPSTQDPRASELTEHNEGTGGGGRESRIRVVAKSEVAVGIRKIKPLTAVKLCAAAFLLVMWRFKLSPGAFMMWVTGVVVFPNLVEVILEIRQFFVAEGAIRKKRQISIASIQSHVSQSVQSLELKKAVDKSNSVPPTPPLA